MATVSKTTDSTKRGRGSVRTSTIHKMDMHINKEKLERIMKNQELTFVELHSRAVTNFGLDLSYKGFMSLLYNQSTWKLLYAYVIQEVLDVPFTEFFELVEIDVEGRKRQKEEFKNRYSRGK